MVHQGMATNQFELTPYIESPLDSIGGPLAADTW